MPASTASQHDRPHCHMLLLAAVACALTAFAAPLHAQPALPADTLTTWGSGEVSATPTRVTMYSFVQGQAELAEDALVMYRDARRRAMQTIEDLEIEGLSIEPGGLSLSQSVDEAQMMQMMGRGGGGAGPSANIVAREPMKIVLRGIDKMEQEELLPTLVRLLNTLQDAGLPVSGMDSQEMMRHRYMETTSLFIFEVEDGEALLDEARQKAVANARSRTNRLAEQAEVRLGRITALHEQPVHDGMSHNYSRYMMMAMYSMGMDDEEMSDTPRSMTLGPIKYRVRVMMNFSIIDSAAQPEPIETSAAAPPKAAPALTLSSHAHTTPAPLPPTAVPAQTTPAP